MHLLERETGLRILTAALSDACNGAGRIALVNGEAGIGKTTLIQHFAATRQPEIGLLWGACDALFTPRPFGPLHDMAPQIGGDLAVLLATESKTDRIGAAMLDHLQRHITIAVFEDLHWADEATLDVLALLSRRITHTNALLILSYRQDELVPQHQLRVLLDKLIQLAATRSIALAPLSAQAVRQLVGSRAVDAATLHRQTSGNPFFITEVLASPPGGIPATIRDAVLARFARLPSAAQALLQTAAVIGPRIEPWLLDAVAGRDTAAREVCLSNGMLLTQGELLSFRHELARQIILGSIPPPHQLTLHRLTLSALTALPETRTDPARLAHHAAAANDHQAVLQYAPAAARAAAKAGTHRAAAALYALALRYADDLLPDKRALLLEAHAHESKLIDDEFAAFTSRRRAVELWQEIGNELKAGENLAYLAIAQLATDRTAAEEVSQAAIEVLELLPPGSALGLAYRTRALIHVINQDYTQALALAQKAAALAEQAGDPRVLAMAYDTLGLAWIYIDYERGCEVLERCREIAAHAGLEPRVAAVYSNLGSASCRLYHFKEAEQALRDGIAYAAERDLDLMRLYMEAWRALTLLYLGRWKEADAAVANVLQRGDISPHNRLPALVASGRLRTRRGATDPQEVSILDEALKLAVSSGYFQHIAPVRLARAEAAWWSRDQDRVLEEVNSIYDQAVGKRLSWTVGELTYWRCLADETTAVPEWIAEPWALQLGGDWRAAAAAWAQLGCPYEQAQALAAGDAHAQLAALTIFDRLGAWPAADRLSQRLRAGGGVRLPRKARRSTRDNPYRLTNRELTVLGLLVAGLSNPAIAARLSLALKTVDHHVSAILAKLGVSSREEAAILARQQNLLDQK